ncbi:hypothetical protein DJ68_09060 [Halorubrum sp. C3]|nr:hypothetical protein DJ68_09060 [Halorubrum sp. C3]
MRSAMPSKVALLSALTVLAVSIAVLLSVTGVSSVVTTDQPREVELRDGTLMLGGDGVTSEPLIDDVRGIDRIEVTTVNGQLLVTTDPRTPPTVQTTQRKQAKQIVASDRSLIDHGTEPSAALYTLYPVFKTASNKQTAVAGANAETRREYLRTVTDTGFTIHKNTTEKTAVFERPTRSVNEDRALVVVDVLDADVRYSIVVDLNSETIETVVQFDHQVDES